MQSATPPPNKVKEPVTNQSAALRNLLVDSLRESLSNR